MERASIIWLMAKKLLKIEVAAVLAIVLVAAAANAVAQRRGEDATTRTLQGTVTDATDAPVNGAVVQLKNTKTLQIRSFITRDKGSYYFHGLSPDVDYEVKAEHQGASSPTRTLSSFDNRRKAVINLKLSK